MPRAAGTFVAFRLPFLILWLLFLPLSFSLGAGGWRLYQSRLAPVDGAQIQLRLRQNMAQWRSYYALFMSNLALQEGLSYRVELWKAEPHLYRMETARLEGAEPVDYQVVICDGEQVYLYSPELPDFYPVHDLERDRVPYFILENYWRDLVEAEHFRLLSLESGVRHRYYLVEVLPPKPSRNRVRELVWLEAETLLPVRIEIYDAFDFMTQVIVFETIRLHPALEAGLFMVEPKGEY